MTINKSHGQTFDHVGVFLDQPVFAHGQLYVALSQNLHNPNANEVAMVFDGEPPFDRDIKIYPKNHLKR